MLEHELLEYIREDLPYFDLTTTLLGADFEYSKLEIVTRGDTVVACSEEAAKIAQMLGAKVNFFLPSSIRVSKGTSIIEIEAKGELLHQAWRPIQVLLEYACGMATYSNDMLTNAREVNETCEILVTRKTMPFSKRFSIRAIVAGGILPHRLGLSETILVFSHHRSLYKDEESFINAFKELKKRAVEKKLVVECDDFKDAVNMLSLGADVVQLDKWGSEDLKKMVAYRDENFPHAGVIAAGGINKDNVAEYAKTGVDAVVTSAPYSAKMSDLGTQWGQV